MWCVLEGSDGAGKTTIANEIHRQLLSEGHNVKLTHLGPPASPDTVLEENIGAPYSEYLPGTGHDMVSDRWSWGNPVYGPIYRPDTDKNGYGDLGLGGLRYTELFGLSRGVLMVLVDVEPDIARERLGSRGDDYIDLKDLERIHAGYTKQLSESALTASVIPSRKVEMSDVPLVATELITRARTMESSAEHLALWPGYIGPVRPKHLALANRDVVIEFLGQADDTDWKSHGFVNPDELSRTEFSALRVALATPNTFSL